MMGYGYDMGAGGWIAMAIFWVALITLIVWGISRSRNGSNGGAVATPAVGGARAGASETAEDILDRRFAAGELDQVTYHSMRATLHSSRTKPPESQ
jgi:putative membrane protein